MTTYKVTFRLADYYGQPKDLWPRKTYTAKVSIAGNPVYNGRDSVLMAIGKPANWGIEILDYKEIKKRRR